MTLQSHSWAYIQRKTWSKRIHAPQYSLEHCLQQPRHGSNLHVPHRGMDKEDVGYIKSPLIFLFPSYLDYHRVLSSLCYTICSYQLSILYIVSIMYTCQFQSPNSTNLTLSPLVSIGLFSIFLFCKKDHLYQFFQIPHICINIQYLFFSDLLHSV